MKKYNTKSTVTIFAIPFMVAGCANLETFGSYDETKFPYRLIAQESGLIPEIKTDDKAVAECQEKTGLQKEEIKKRDISCRRKSISIQKEEIYKYIDDKSINLRNAAAKDKDTLYFKMIGFQKKLWEFDFQVTNDALNQAFTEHLIQRRVGEIKSDAFNLPILGGLVGIAASALYKASTESIGGLATGIGGLTATREYFNVEDKRDLHRDAAIGLACLKTETARLYGLSASVLTIRQSADELKDSVSSAIGAVEEMSKQANPNDTDRQALSVQKETIDAAQNALALAERNLADYRDMPHRILTAASKLQEDILRKGGRGDVNGATVNRHIYARFNEAAGATQKIGELRGQIAQAKAGKFVMETSKGAESAKITTLTADGAPKDKSARSVQGNLVIGIQNTLHSVENLGADNEMSKVSIRVAACGTPLQVSQTP